MRIRRALTLLVLLGLLVDAGMPIAAAEPPPANAVDLVEPGQPTAVPPSEPSTPQTSAGKAAEDETLGRMPDGDAPAPGGGIQVMMAPVGGIRVLDTFTRVDGPLGGPWIVKNGDCSTVGNSATCGSYGRAVYTNSPGGGNTAEADVMAVGTELQYAALLLNYNSGVNNVFIKVQQQDGGGYFNYLGCRIGNGYTSFGLGFQPLATPFKSAHMQVTRYGDEVTIRFSRIDGGTKPDQVYVCSGAPNPEGTGIGIAGYGNAARIDNFGTSTLWDNGAVATNVTGGLEGAAVSTVQTALEMTLYGKSASKAYKYSIADDFVVSERQGWHLEQVKLYSYQTGTYANPPTSTITAAYYRIWDGRPDLVTSTVVYGDLDTNRLRTSYWSGMYRVLDTGLTDATRPIMSLALDADVILPPGHYWLEYSVAGSLSSGPWIPPVTMLGQVVTGDALQYTSFWAPISDGTNPRGMPFILEGEVIKEVAIPIVRK